MTNEEFSQLAAKPRHIGIIMDGNGRWAKKRALPRSVGHKFGARTFRAIAEYCIKLDIEVVTFFAFSTENWKRPKEEVDGIMQLFIEYLQDSFNRKGMQNMRVRFLGDRAPLSDEAKALMKNVEQETAEYKNQLNIAINYGSHDELVTAFNKLNGKKAEISAQDISEALYTHGQPDVDLLVRTGGEQRISNFLLWQSAYAELYFTDTLWPDFKEKDLDQALTFFAHRHRRFGAAE